MSIFMLAQAQDGAAAPAAPVTTATESVPAGQPAPEQPNIFEQIFGGPMFMFVVIIILFWVMLIRPQRKAQKEQQARIASCSAGTRWSRMRAFTVLLKRSMTAPFPSRLRKA